MHLAASARFFVDSPPLKYRTSSSSSRASTFTVGVLKAAGDSSSDAAKGGEDGGDGDGDGGDGNGNGSMTFGCVQTPYANGASTLYMRNTLGLTVATARTGVKVSPSNFVCFSSFSSFSF